ncbi:hypothetical protein [Citrobacter sp. CtB7.12]|uniref:hypothetical protein n=1 Tax=Citrobacter sp. CtB7.12 TaxID=1696093 RepID=UPI0006BA5AF5|nr:hypothetical protein [Citrobacter sp. CtB7.12]
MFSHSSVLSARNKSDWLTIPEAVCALNEFTGLKIMDYDIYRHALQGRITLSVNFQSTIFLRKIKLLENKIKCISTGNSLVNRLCMLNSGCFLAGRNLIISTEGRYIPSSRQLLDTPLMGYEYVLLQCLLARTMQLQCPLRDGNNINYGITVTSSGEVFQLFECVSWRDRINSQLLKLPRNMRSAVKNQFSEIRIREHRKGWFPLHHFPQDAWIVLRYSELEKFARDCTGNTKPPPTASRMSTAMARLFWLACRNNDAISPLIGKPYKLQAIFEQWARNEGITDKLSGDTIRNALERGSPPPAKTREN